MKPKLKLLQPTEHEIQAGIVRWADLNSGRFPALRVLFAIPNGGYRHWTTAVRLKQEGVRPGVPDLLLPVPMVRPNLLWYHGLFIEVKRSGRGRVSEQQAVWAGVLKGLGYQVEVVRSLDEGIGVLKRYLKI